MKIYENYSLKSHNTFGFDIQTRWFIEYENEEDIQRILSDEYFYSQSFLHIGEGSNLLFTGNYSGVILHSAIRDIRIEEEDDKSVIIKVGAGVNWDDFVLYCIEKGWGGVENLSGIPGEVGASAVQNIGAYGMEVCETISQVHSYCVETGKENVFGNKDCRYGYRDSIFKKEYKNKFIITHVLFRLSKKSGYKYRLEYAGLKDMLEGKKMDLFTLREAVLSMRNAKLPDPVVWGNAGSFFMNPCVKKAQVDRILARYPALPFYPVSENYVKIPAAWLIEHAGLKGKRLGKAKVYEKQPLVLINEGGATPQDVVNLSNEIMETVKNQFGIGLIPEVNFV